jgi:hypothetical protein
VRPRWCLSDACLRFSESREHDFENFTASSFGFTSAAFLLARSATGMPQVRSPLHKTQSAPI